MNRLQALMRGMSPAEQEAFKEQVAQYAMAHIRIIYAIDYRSQLLATTALLHPTQVRELSADRRLIRKVVEKQARAHQESAP